MPASIRPNTLFLSDAIMSYLETLSEVQPKYDKAQHHLDQAADQWLKFRDRKPVEKKLIEIVKEAADDALRATGERHTQKKKIASNQRGPEASKKPQSGTSSNQTFSKPQKRAQAVGKANSRGGLMSETRTTSGEASGVPSTSPRRGTPRPRRERTSPVKPNTLQGSEALKESLKYSGGKEANAGPTDQLDVGSGQKARNKAGTSSTRPDDEPVSEDTTDGDSDDDDHGEIYTIGPNEHPDLRGRNIDKEGYCTMGPKSSREIEKTKPGSVQLSNHRYIFRTCETLAAGVEHYDGGTRLACESDTTYPTTKKQVKSLIAAIVELFDMISVMVDSKAEMVDVEQHEMEFIQKIHKAGRSYANRLNKLEKLPLDRDYFLAGKDSSVLEHVSLSRPWP